MKRTEEIGFASLMVIAFATFVILGWGYAKRPRIVPLTLSIPGLALSVLQLGNIIVKSRRAGKKGTSETPAKTTEDPGEDREPFLSAQTRKILETWAWIVALALGINFLGFMVALPIFLLGFIKFFAKRTWKLSVLISASFTLAVYLVFYVGLKTTL